MHEFLLLAGALAVAGLSMYGIVINVHYLWITREKTDVKKEMITDLEKRLREALEAINNAAVSYIEGGPYENDLPGMEFAVEIDRLSRDFVRPPEGEEDT